MPTRAGMGGGSSNEGEHRIRKLAYTEETWENLYTASIKFDRFETIGQGPET